MIRRCNSLPRLGNLRGDSGSRETALPWGGGRNRLCVGIRFEGDGRIVFPAEERCLVDQDSDDPAFEGAFTAECRRVARGGKTTVFDRLVGFLDAVEDAACDELKQPAAARELQFEGGRDVFAGLAVGFEVAVISGKAGPLDALRGSGEEF